MRRIVPLLLLAAPCLADGPADNLAERVRPVPMPGIAVPAETRAALEDDLKSLAAKVAAIEARKSPKLARSLPDVRIYHKAVRDALQYNEFFDKKEFTIARSLLEEGTARAEALLKDGETPWTRGPGMVVLGYESRIDGSVQPYGLIVPDSYQPAGPFRHRLDVWFHGRQETLSEVAFLDAKRGRSNEFQPEDTFVLHPYGRFCNAFKFAGEIDVLEALDDVKSRFKIDENRVSVRGFSMGGAAAWHFAVHYPDRWFAANPGAGFSETPQFLKVFQNEKVAPTWYERTLWHLYDCPDWSRNLLSLPVVAYSGELDSQKQAADVMEEALAKHGVPLTHIIGPRTKHQYEKVAKAEVSRRMDALAAVGRVPRPDLGFETHTLQYNRCQGITVDALTEHWKPSRVDVKWLGSPTNRVSHERILVETSNVEAITLHLPPGQTWLRPGRPALVQFDPTIPDRPVLSLPGPESDGSWHASFHREGNDWKVGSQPEAGLRKKHGLQGPIDDAFLDSFVFVNPTGRSSNPKVQAWVESESKRAISRWRTQFRGDARVKTDVEINDADIAASNLVLWGDPQSNAVLAKIADKLPIRWGGDSITVGERTYLAADHVPILIFPNPLNPKKYVVLNSGFTYREYDDLNNARQVPRLPDWAVVDVNTPPNSRFPGKVVAADFFDETWKLKPPHAE